MDRQHTLVDLFSGAGGFSHGFEMAGFRTIAGVDMHADSMATFGRNHAEAKVVQTDISTITGADLAGMLGLARGELDCLVGGPPCQGFSKCLAARAMDPKRLGDPRNYLYRHFMAFVARLRPRAVVIENVPDILRRNNGSFGRAILESFTDLGYAVEARVLNAADYGVPQFRKRAIFIAGRDAAIEFPLPTHVPAPRPTRRTPQSKYRSKNPIPKHAGNLLAELPVGPNVWDAIGDLHGAQAASPQAACAYAAEPLTPYQAAARGGLRAVRNHSAPPPSDRQRERMLNLQEGEGMQFLPEELRTKTKHSNAYRRLQSNALALTLTTYIGNASSGMYIHPKENRIVTAREAARLQSFQDSFVFHGGHHSMYRQIGNSVAPLLARAVAEAVASHLT